MEKKVAKAIPNLLLRHARQQRNWSLKDVGDRIGTDSKAVGRWERGIISPSPYYRQKLCEIFGKTAEELGFIKKATDETNGQHPNQSSSPLVQTLTSPVSEAPSRDASTPAASIAETSVSPPDVPALPIWNVPYRRNPFFTGREAILDRLHCILLSGKTAALTHPRAISGLGGIGKTQTAVEYAYRNYSSYQAVLWTRADSREILMSDFVAIAGLLNLPEKHEQDQHRVVAAVKRWLQDHVHWLLILDNIEDLAMVNDFVPTLSRGHVLLTCRVHVTGTVAQHLEMDKMTPEEAALFVLRRAKLIEPDAPVDDTSYADWIQAKAIAEAMDGLPLALDQAGAYIEETARSLSEYLDLYHAQRAALLKHRGMFASDHPEPVATTWSLSFEKVIQANPAAADLLRLCAFLHPDAIPEEIFLEGVPELGPILQPVAADPCKLASAIQELHKYSLVRRNPDTSTLTIHRLVQAVIKDGMDEHMEGQWAECTVRAVNRTFPDGQFATWNLCQRCLSHVQVCAALIKQYRMKFIEAAQLLNRAGCYLRERVQYSEAEPLLKQALKVYEQVLGPEHPNVAESLSDLARLYKEQAEYTQAETLYLQASVIFERALGPENFRVAINLNNLALLYHEEGKYIQAEPLYQRALAIYERTLGPEHPEVAISLNNLALLYEKQGKYTQAETIHQRSLAIRKQAFGLEHPNVATSLNNLALVYDKQGKYAKAEDFFQQALAIVEKTLGPEHPHRASSLNNLADVYRELGKYDQAQQLHLQALAIREKVLGPEHPHVAISLNKLAQLYADQRKYAQAKVLFQRALVIREKVLGLKHPEVARTLNNLADIHRTLGEYAQAETLYRRALAIVEQTLGPEHPDVTTCLNNLAEVYRAIGKYMQTET